MKFDSTLFFYLSTIGYFLGFVFYLLHVISTPARSTEKQRGKGVGITAEAALFTKETSWGKIATWTTTVTVAIATIGVVLRVYELSRASEMFMPLPVSNTYETFAFFSWVIPLAYLFFEWRYKFKALGVFVTGLAFILIAFASSPIIPKEVRPLVPALQSYWLTFHVLLTLVGEGFFAVAVAASLLFLWQRRRGSPSFNLKKLDDISYKAIAIGFPLFTIGALIFGAIWAQRAWGRFWGWDPKETWSLITWLFYALYLHVRINWGWKDAKAAWLAVIGFAAAIFTWFGVNYVLSGLHSYS